MTANQIAFAQAIENERHNKEGEAETLRHNTELEKLQGEANKIQKWKTAIEAAGTVVNAVTGVGNLATSVADKVLKRKEIINAKDIAEANLRLRAQEIQNNWNVGLIHEMNVAQSNANTLQLGLARNFIDFGNLQETIRSNKEQEGIKLTQLGNDYYLKSNEIGMKKQQIDNDRYIAELNNMNQFANQEIERQKLEQNERLAQQKNETTVKAAKQGKRGRVIGALLGAAAAVIKLAMPF